jgi:hypothetical protein
MNFSGHEVALLIHNMTNDLLRLRGDVCECAQHAIADTLQWQATHACAHRHDFKTDVDLK